MERSGGEEGKHYRLANQDKVYARNEGVVGLYRVKHVYETKITDCTAISMNATNQKRKPMWGWSGGDGDGGGCEKGGVKMSEMEQVWDVRRDGMNWLQREKSDKMEAITSYLAKHKCCTDNTTRPWLRGMGSIQ